MPSSSAKMLRLWQLLLLGGSSVGLVETCQNASKPTRSRSCQTRSILVELLGIALQHFFLHRMPDERMQLDEARREADLGDVPRSRQVDREFADRMRCRSGGQDDHAIGKRDRLLEVMRDEQHGLSVRRPQLAEMVFHQLARLDVER